MLLFDKVLLKRLQEIVPASIYSHATSEIEDKNGKPMTEEELTNFSIPELELKVIGVEEKGMPEINKKEIPWLVRGGTNAAELEANFPSPAHSGHMFSLSLFMTDDGWLAIQIDEYPSARKTYGRHIMAISIPYWQCCQKCSDGQLEKFYSTDEIGETIIDFINMAKRLAMVNSPEYYRNPDPSAH